MLQGATYGGGKEGGEGDRFRLSSLSSIWSGSAAAGNGNNGVRNGSLSAPPVEKGNTWSSTLFNPGKKDL